MALNGTYAGLKESVSRWLSRSDLTDAIPDFITMAEARLNDNLRIGGMEVVGTGSTDALGAANLPADFLEARMVVATTQLDSLSNSQILVDENGVSLVDEETGALLISNVEAGISRGTSRILDRIDPAWAINAYGSAAGGLADVYAIRGSTLTVYPVQTTLLVVTYYAKLAALSDTNPTNWLLKRYPQMYLYASLLEAMPVLQDDTRVVMWKAGLDQAISDARLSDIGTRFSNGAMRLSGPTP